MTIQVMLKNADLVFAALLFPLSIGRTELLGGAVPCPKAKLGQGSPCAAFPLFFEYVLSLWSKSISGVMLMLNESKQG